MEGFITWYPRRDPENPSETQRMADIVIGECQYTIRAWLPIWIDPAHRGAVVAKLQALPFTDKVVNG